MIEKTKDVLFYAWGIHKVRWQGRGRGKFAKCQRYNISLCSKSVNEGEREVKIPQNYVNIVYEFPLSSVFYRISDNFANI